MFTNKYFKTDTPVVLLGVKEKSDGEELLQCISSVAKQERYLTVYFDFSSEDLGGVRRYSLSTGVC